MAEITKPIYISLDNLTQYNTGILDIIATGDSKSIKNAYFQNDKLLFFKDEIASTVEVDGKVQYDESKADFVIPMTSSDVAKLKLDLGDVATLKTTAKGSVVVAINELKDAVDKNASDISDLQTAVETAQAQADKGVEDAATAQKTADDITALVGFTAGAGEDDPKTLKAYVDAEVSRATGDASKVAEDLAAEIERATGAEEANAGNISTIDGKVTTLIGDDANKSVRTIANEELAAQLIPESAKESLNTLEEIASWIQNHPDDAAAMNKAIEDLEKLVGTLPEGITATTVVGYIAELVSAEETRATGVEADFEERISDIEEAIGEGGNVSEQIDAKINALDATVTNEVEGEDKPDVTVQVVETDGKLVSVSATVNAKYDVEGAASAVQGSTTSTVADVEAKVDAFTEATSEQIAALFQPKQS